MGSISPPIDDQDLTFPSLPPFPTDVPTVPLLRISLEDLLAGSAAEEEKLWRACCDLGFFYFDLRSTLPGADLLSCADALFALGNDVFDLPVAEKETYSMMQTKSYFGYKGYGAFKDRRGLRDRNEFWNVSKDDVLGVGEMLPNPEVLRREENRGLLGRFMRGSHGLVGLVLGVLERRLGLSDGTLRELHRLDGVSGDQVRWVKSPPQPSDDRKAALGEHTDYGSVTILFNRLGGLQVLPPGEDSTWAYVKPLRGHCVVNLGDAMVKFTAGILRSNIHRVANPPGAQQDETRMSLVYFNRPLDDIKLGVLKGSEMIDAKKKEMGIGDDEEEMTAKEWILKRAFERTPGTDKERLEKRDGGVEAQA